MPTRIEVTGGPHRPRCLLGAGALIPRLVPADPGIVRIVLVAAHALLLAGDQVEVELSVTGAVRVEILENAGTVAYDMRGGSARWDVTGVLADGARLAWHGQPFVISHGADVDKTLRLDLDRASRAVVRETYVFGRSGEVGGTLRTSTRIRQDGQPVLAEDLRLDPEGRASWVGLHGARCLDTVTTVGERLADDADVLQADGEASVARRICVELHDSDLEPVWCRATGTAAVVHR